MWPRRVKRGGKVKRWNEIAIRARRLPQTSPFSRWTVAFLSAYAYAIVDDGSGAMMKSVKWTSIMRFNYYQLLLLFLSLLVKSRTSKHDFALFVALRVSFKIVFVATTSAVDELKAHALLQVVIPARKVAATRTNFFRHQANFCKTKARKRRNV